MYHDVATILQSVKLVCKAINCVPPLCIKQPKSHFHYLLIVVWFMKCQKIVEIPIF